MGIYIHYHFVFEKQHKRLIRLFCQNRLPG